jgi:hypothetical protein
MNHFRNALKSSAPYYDPDAPLIRLTSSVNWTTTDAAAGTLITGGIGGGKSSGPGDMVRRALLRSSALLPGGMGGIVFFAKNGECDEWVTLCQRLGRGEDVIRVTPGGRYTFNPLRWISQWGDDDATRGPIATVALLEEISTAVDPQSAGAGAGENAFFEGAHRTKLTNLVHICQLGGLPVSLPLMRAISSSAPQTVAQGKDAAWQAGSVCWAILREADARTRGDSQARKDLEECRTYFLTDYPMLSDRTRGVIEIMFTSLVRPFLTRPLRPIFCEDSNIWPEMCFEGKILLIDIPVQEYHQTAKLAALAFKRCFQLAVQRRAGPPGSLRPVFWFADEAQNFLSPKDTEYQAVARSAGGVTVLLTQQISSIREALGSKDRAENLTANLSTKFFCNNTGETARWASQLIGERWMKARTTTTGGTSSLTPDQPGAGGSANGGVSISDQKREWVPASEFQTLRRGGKANGYEVDAIVYAGGKSFPGEDGPQPFTTLSFEQQR